MNSLYAAYGFTIASEILLPELLPGAGDPAVTIRLDTVVRQPHEVDKAGDFVRTGTNEAVLFWENVGVFLVREGREIIIEPCSNVDMGLLHTFLLGSALGLLLHQRGLLTLHASAVEIAGGAVAFIGWKGHGKSTTATALDAHGHRLLTDDIVAIDLTSSDNPVVYPGFPQIKLRPDAASALVDQPDLLPRLHPEVNKLAHQPRDNFSLEPLPLRAIFMLDQGPEPSIDDVIAQEALLALISHSYALRFLKTAGATPSHFQQCDRLRRQVPIWRLRRPYSLDALPAIVHLIEEQMIHPIALV